MGKGTNMKKTRLTKRGKIVATILALVVIIPLSLKGCVMVIDAYIAEIGSYQQAGADYARQMEQLRAANEMEVK